jgi:hypothetical protein
LRWFLTWRAANLLIRRHGANAGVATAKRADLMLGRGEEEGRLLWARIRRAIETLPALLMASRTKGNWISLVPSSRR